ncbi:hypothetical protein [Amycolatopsis echigonensis]|uniref:hypothetical protein n=1 Tax=Amycolatopsis echigonensis TaxID=2576905 RepID=UPI001FC9B54D|nr:hypothetical protein [Amycolatopsis niigatensis]
MTEIADRPAVASPIAGPNRGLTKFLDPLPVPPVLRPPWSSQDMITIPMAAKALAIAAEHLADLCRTFPGPTIDVRSGKQLPISWSNEIEGKFPLVAVRGPVADGPTSRPGRELDRPGYSIADGVADLPGGDRELPLILTDRNLDTDPATGRLTGQLLDKFPVCAERADDPVRLIGTDSGLLPAPAPLPPGGLTVAPAERFDVLIDFSRFRGQKLKLRNADPRLGGVRAA